MIRGPRSMSIPSPTGTWLSPCCTRSGPAMNLSGRVKHRNRHANY